MSRSRWRILIEGGAVLAIVGSVFLLTLIPLGHITDFGKEMAFDRRMLTAHLYKIQLLENGQVHFESDGTLGKVKDPAGDYWVAEFDLAPQETFWSLPKRDGYTEFRLHSVEADGVVIEYEARFIGGGDPRRATVLDHGLVRLGWKNEENPYTQPPVMGLRMQ